ncbi:hypothetical protein [Brevibacillus formosus]|uniref:hypothetical protein n=1 Tax=Brevibacillus formosus TaxID=54913 RepID=UPI003F1C7194
MARIQGTGKDLLLVLLYHNEPLKNPANSCKIRGLFAIVNFSRGGSIRGEDVPRPRKSEEEKKHPITISLRGWLIKKLREHGKYNSLIESLLVDYFEKMDKKD